VSRDREFYELLYRLIARRDVLVSIFNEGHYPVRARRRAGAANCLGIQTIRFRCGTRELRRPSGTNLRRMGVTSTPDMLRMIREIACLDEAIHVMLGLARKTVERARKVCRAIADARQIYGIDASRDIAAVTTPLMAEGIVCLLPYKARQMAWEAIHTALVTAFRAMTTRNVVVIPKSKGYTPRVAVNIYVYFDRTVTPPDARWTLYLKPGPNSRYVPTQSIRPRHGRKALTIGRVPTYELRRRLHLKPHIPFFMQMVGFVSAVRKVRTANRALWEFVRRKPCSKTVRSLLPIDGTISDAALYRSPRESAPTVIPAESPVASRDITHGEQDFPRTGLGALS